MNEMIEVNELNELNSFNEFNVMREHEAQTVGKRHIQMARGTHRGQEARTEDGDA